MRTQILQDFQNGSYEALVSTSVLGRGIDLLNVLMASTFICPKKASVSYFMSLYVYDER